MKNSTLTIIFCALTSYVFAQQGNLYRFNLENQFINNPAATAPYTDVNVSMMHTKPFTGIQSSPSNSFVSAQIPISLYNMSIGGMIENQSLGVIRDTRLVLCYSYKMLLDSRRGSARDDYIAIGMNAQLSQMRIDGSSFTNAVDFNDPNIIANSQNDFGWNVGIGAMYSSQSEIYRGNYNNLFQLGISTSKTVISSRNLSNLSYRESRIINAFGSYSFGDYEDLLIRSLIELTYENSKLYDARLTLTSLWNEIMVAGLSYDLNGHLGFEIGIETKSLLENSDQNFKITAMGGLPITVSASQINYGYGLKVVYTLEN